MTEPVARPIFFVVDEDPSVVETLVGDLERRFQADYRVMGETSAQAALERLMGRVGAWPPVVAVTQAFDESVARTLLQMRVADFLVKPVKLDTLRAMIERWAR